MAGASIEGAGDRVVIGSWTSTAARHDVRIGPVEATFVQRAIRAERRVLRCVAVRDSDVLTGARSPLDEACSRVAGSTCLIEGCVRSRAQ